MLPRQQQVLGGALVVRNGQVLILKRSSADSIFPEQWEIPAGKKKLGETLEHTVVRECREETGLEVCPVRLVNHIEYGRDSHGLIRDCTQLNFLCSLSHPEQTVRLSNAHQEYRWIAKSDLALLTNSNLTKTLNLLFDLLPSNSLPRNHMHPHKLRFTYGQSRT